MKVLVGTLADYVESDLQYDHGCGWRRIRLNGLIVAQTYIKFGLVQQFSHLNQNNDVMLRVSTQRLS